MVTSMFKVILLAMAAGIGSASGVFAAEHIVDQKNKKFSVASIAIENGDRINFSNSDRIAHHVYSKDLYSFDSGRIPAGRGFTQPFDKTGKFKIRCKIHPKMKLDIIVQNKK